MSLIARLAEKSWQNPGIDGRSDPADYRPPAAKVGLVAFMGVATVIFTLLSAAYLMRMGIHGNMGHGTAGDWRPLPKPPQLWINTGLLALGCLAWEAARRLARSGEAAPMRSAAALGNGLGVLFLLGQLLLWRHYQAGGYFLAANPANAFFYLLTALHGLHLAGGVIAGLHAPYPPAGGHDARLRIQLCAIYWHFLLLVWIVLLVLLLST
ncbi:heme-copper oxidase subunit III [Novosphingobium flavum]|uniref:Heme-copper oxidase subunit III n=1 Tax=Novosphingobium flavum TaxID=1778672 RepID=A0A7X1FR79_9SPHN|nr:heme-copper oxidase subunit III [Novosphingobium flavum]MBC2665463.1 heme-copper oxidase subunit III [Novosphingobium flavum]